MQLQSLTSLLHKKMDRQEFLRTIALIALTLVGLGFFVKNAGTTTTTSGSAAVPAKQNNNDTYGL